MKKIKLCILWHQHQPFYKDTVNDIYRMPWTFMHGVKDYYDMLVLARRNKVPVTMNLVPILLYQLNDYLENPMNDELLRAVLKNPTELTEGEKKKLYTYGFESMNPAKITGNTGYQNLLHIYNTGSDLQPNQLLDLQVLLLISWIGEVTFKENERLSQLRLQTANFTIGDREYVFDTCMNIMKKILPAHLESWEKNEIEITTSPFFHPIVPLLGSFEAARVSVPDLPLPGVKANMKNDAGLHIQMGRDYVEKNLGRRTRGFWPAEGAVSPFAADLYAGCEVEYLMTDEGILANSLHMSGHNFRKDDLYSPYVYNTPSGDVKFFFRDTELSDLIGFTYSQWKTEDAIGDFIHRLKSIAQSTQVEDPVVCIMLDGENAWESYVNNGYDFLDGLYAAIAAADFIEPMTFSTVLDSKVKAKRLDKLFSGSWIYSNLNTWIGHSEKNRAWELLVSVKALYDKAVTSAPKEIQEKARFEMMAAEGSDWFWWYGDDFYSHFSDDFDELFRLHLKNVCDLLEVQAPDNLHLSIRKKHRGGLREMPCGFLTTYLDGKIEGFFDWLGAGEFDLAYDASTMQMGSRRLKTLRFGPSMPENRGIYLGLPGNFKDCINEIMEIQIMNGGLHTITWDLEHKKTVFVSDDLQPAEIQIVQGDIIEIFIPMKEREEKVMVQFKILKNGNVVEKAPMYSMAALPLGLATDGDWVL